MIKKTGVTGGLDRRKRQSTRQRERHTISDGNVDLGMGRGARVLHIVLTVPPAFFDMRLADALVQLL